MEKLFSRHLVGEDYSMEELNVFELSILGRLAVKYPNIKPHIPLLQVLNREITGVGMYVNFCYSEQTDDVLRLNHLSYDLMSTDDTIQVTGLEHGLAWVVYISDGKIDFMELVTYGEAWDGNIENCYFCSEMQVNSQEMSSQRIKQRPNEE